MCFELPLAKPIEGIWRDRNIEQPMLVGQSCGLEAKTHAVGPPLSIQQQVLIGFQLNNNNAAEVGDLESPLQSPLAELNGVKGFADQLEQLFELAGGVEKRINAQLRLSPPPSVGGWI